MNQGRRAILSALQSLRAARRRFLLTRSAQFQCWFVRNDKIYIDMKDHFKIGTIIKTRGLKGELQLFVDFEQLQDINFPAMFFDIAGKLVPYFVQSVKYQKNTAWLYLEDVDT